MTDLFGLNREKKIVGAGVRTVFTPHQPIMSVKLFLGRQTEVQKLIEHLNTPGQHALLFGERGVGKSSLANIAAEVLLQDLITGNLIQKRCDSSDSFLSVVAEPLAAVGIDIKVNSSQKSQAEGGKAGLKVPFAEAGIDTKTSVTETSTDLSSRATSPSWVADKLSQLNGLFVIDEVDALANPDDKKALAELVKLLSDAGAPLKILLVGIAETAAELTAGHPSVQRCLRETRLGRMTEPDLQQIILQGQKTLNLEFSKAAIDRIVRVSSGYPHFTHLLSLKAAEDAVADDRSYVNVQHVEQATRRAVEDAEGSLKKVYEDAARSYGTDLYKKILLAAAMCPEEEIVASQLRIKYESLFGEQITQGSLNNYLKRLVSPDDKTILRRVAKGVYRFSDPRMSSYVRIAQSYLKPDAEQISADDA